MTATIDEAMRNQIQNEVWFEAVTSRGPGGQNVNKVSSAAILYWSLSSSAALNEEQKARAQERLAAITNRTGLIYLRSDEFRDLEQNKSRCIEKLFERLRLALHQPKRRRATRPTRASKIKKREKKQQRSQTKKLRRRVEY